MRRSNGEMLGGPESTGANTAECKRKTRARVAGNLGVRSFVLGLIATLAAGSPGFALEFSGNHEFRGNPSSPGGASKTEDASAGVNGISGAASVSIPIAVPPGPGGLVPSLSLDYSSGQGDGPFGLDWSLRLGEVRCTARFGVPDFANCPEFELDGQLLVGPDANGRHHTRVESFQKIVLHGTGESAHWEVTAPGGTRRLYGEAANSKIGSDGRDTPATAPTARWLLSKIVDLHGNEIRISYDRSDVGVAYPSTITYASGERVVTFRYERRPDELLDFPGGIPRNITRRLREIEVKSLDAIFGRLLITYSARGDYPTHRSRVAATQLFGRGCDAPDPVANCPSLPAQTYTYTETTVSGSGSYWGGAGFGQIYVETGAQTESRDLGVRVADVNGDGLPDFLIGHCTYAGEKPPPCDEESEGPGVLINGDVSGVQSQAWTTAIQSLTYEAPTLTVESVLYDTFFNYTRACNATTGTVTRRISFATQEADWEPIAINGNTETFTPWPSWYVVDVNGDGFADLVTSNRGGVVPLAYDCAGTPTPPPTDTWYEWVSGGELSQVIFLNNGFGWDPAPAGVAESLPIFQTQTIVKHTNDDGNVIRTGTDCDAAGFLGGVNGMSSYCTTYMDLRPQFVELNGDGLLDIIALAPDEGPGNEEYGYLLLDHFNDAAPWWIGAPRSFAWIQNADGSGWTPAPDFDLSFPHFRFNWMERKGYDPGHGQGGMQPYDAGVHFVDLNRDGLTDVVHDVWTYDFVSEPAGVLLNTGTGWCNELGTGGASVCDGKADPTRYQPPIAFNEYTENTLQEDISKSEQLVFVDLNGDGWVDLLQGKDGIQGANDVLRAWLHDPSAPEVGPSGKPSVWVERTADFAPPKPFHPGTQFADFDGNGTADLAYGWRLYLGQEETTETAHYASQSTHSDLLASVDNGRGGNTAFTYVSAVVQRDAAMEADAEAHAAAIGDADGNSGAVTRFIPSPVVSEQTLSGVGVAASVTTHYRYARPRFDPVKRSSLGFGLVETTRPDDSRVDAYYDQREGLVGRPSASQTFDEFGNPIHHSEQTWVLASNPGSIPGAMAGVDIPRLEARESHKVYGQDDGPVTRSEYSYDDTHGYNFVSQVIRIRATGSLTTTFTPDVEAFNENKWLVGLVGEKQQQHAGVSYSREVYDYTTDGRLAARKRDIGLRDGTAAPDLATTVWEYDSWGNVTKQIDTRGGGESDRVVEFCYDGDGGGNSWCPSVPGNTPETHSLRVGLKDAIGGVIALEYDWVTGAVLHVERINESGAFRDSLTVVRDAFGRSQEQWFRGASFGRGDPDVLLASTIYHDAPIATTPAYVERFQYAEEAGGAPIRTARYLDGFGNALREVAETPAGYRGSGVFRDPVARIIRSVGPVDCSSDAACSNITKTTEPYTEQEVDAAGRVVRTTSPDGEFIQDYSRMARMQPAGFGAGNLFDTAELTDANNHTTRRLMDGNRVVWVDECANASCSSFDSTFYTYEPTGEISSIYDALANSIPDYASPARYLRYHYDTLGRVIQTDEPNTGSSSAGYDHQGNVTSTTNVRGDSTFTRYDALGRLLSIDRPSKVGEWDLYYSYDPISRKRQTVTTPASNYSDTWEYDDFGQVKRQIRNFNAQMVMDFEYDLLGRPTKIYYPSADSSASYVYEGAYLDQVCLGDDFCAGAPENLLISDVQYDGLGRRTDTVMSTGTVHREYYDMQPAVGRSVNALKRLAITAGTVAGALDFTYQYDPMGNVIEIDDQSMTYDASAIYTYDERNRLASWTDAADDTQWYTYDSLGNLAGHGVASAGDINQTFDPATRPHQIAFNRIGEDYAYDADGNVIKRGSTHFVYDSANRPVCTGTAPGICDGPGYRYDVDGQLLWDGATGEQRMGDLFRRKSIGSVAYSNIVAFGEVIAEVRQTNAQLRAVWTPMGWSLPVPKDRLLPLLIGAGVLAWIALLAWLGVWRAFSEAPATATLVLALTTLLVVPPPAWGLYYDRQALKGKDGGGGATVRSFFRDHLGSVAYVTSPNVRQAYEPFGKAIFTGTATVDEFTGKEYHDATDMYYFGARWYDAEAGRFAGVDPLFTQPVNPQQLNAYSYALNDPIDLTDPTGMCVRPGIGGIGCGVGEGYGSSQWGHSTTTHNIRWTKEGSGSKATTKVTLRSGAGSGAGRSGNAGYSASTYLSGSTISSGDWHPSFTPLRNTSLLTTIVSAAYTGGNQKQLTARIRGSRAAVIAGALAIATLFQGQQQSLLDQPQNPTGAETFSDEMQRALEPQAAIAEFGAAVAALVAGLEVTKAGLLAFGALAGAEGTTIGTAALVAPLVTVTVAGGLFLAGTGAENIVRMINLQTGASLSTPNSLLGGQFFPVLPSARPNGPFDRTRGR